MVRKKKGLTPKRKPVVRRVGTACKSAEDLAVALDLPKSVAADWERKRACDNMTRLAQECGEYDPPSRWSRVVGWVRENPLESTLVAGWLALTAAIVAVLP